MNTDVKTLVENETVQHFRRRWETSRSRFFKQRKSAVVAQTGKSVHGIFFVQLPLAKAMFRFRDKVIQPSSCMSKCGSFFNRIFFFSSDARDMAVITVHQFSEVVTCVECIFFSHARIIGKATTNHSAWACFVFFFSKRRSAHAIGSTLLGQGWVHNGSSSWGDPVQSTGRTN